MIYKIIIFINYLKFQNISDIIFSISLNLQAQLILIK